MSPEQHQTTGEILRNLLAVAWLAPLVGFAVEIFAGYWQKDRKSKAAAYLAVGCIGLGFVCSLAALLHWGNATDWAALTGEHHASTEHHESTPGDDHGATDDHAATTDDGQRTTDDPHSPLTTHHSPKASAPFTGTFYRLAHFGDLHVTIDYYIDSLTLVMFVMVTLIATCIHIFALGYMSDELTDEYVDHQARTSEGRHLHRLGRFYQFFAYMSLFSFSMLGLVLAGNVFMVFVFWELVGICSYLLIGFYVERRSASTAANKAFIMNRVGDFGFLIGLMILWTSFGTFQFGEHRVGSEEETRPGLFQMVRGETGELNVATTEVGEAVVMLHGENGENGSESIPYWLLVAAGLGIFAGCVGKSAQFPLQTWLPDAMEGPTPVSALVHSATMVAAGVYLAGRFYPVFTPEVLMVIAYVGCITLFLAATIAIVATDIKRVLAYSTISQLGYMMLGIGVAGWAAGLFHLITHAFFKSLMFLCAGSVIVGCHHEQEMPRMGGLWRKMPITAFTMLVGVIAIAGLAIPGITIWGAKIAFSGYHSKDAIVATSLAFTKLNPVHFLLFVVPLVTAGITAFYMFRLWFYTFAGEPRDRELYDHVHESPWVMTAPLILLAALAAFCGVGGEGGPLFGLMADSEPAGVAAGGVAGEVVSLTLPGHADLQAQPAAGGLTTHEQAGLFALMAAIIGALVAWLLYGKRVVNPAEIARQLPRLHGFLVEKWQFDTLYDAMFVRPARRVAAALAWFDRTVIDGFLHSLSRLTVGVANWDRKFDERVVDGLVNLVGTATFAFGRSLRGVQTGRLRQYVMFIAVGVVALFVLLFAFLPKA